MIEHEFPSLSTCEYKFSAIKFAVNTSVAPSGNSTSHSLVSRIGFAFRLPIGFPSASRFRLVTHAFDTVPMFVSKTSAVRYWLVVRVR
jgi:hypothetical protein